MPHYDLPSDYGFIDRSIPAVSMGEALETQIVELKDEEAAFEALANFLADYFDSHWDLQKILATMAQRGAWETYGLERAHCEGIVKDANRRGEKMRIDYQNRVREEQRLAAEERQAVIDALTPHQRKVLGV